jgi:hypothetical protein
MVSKALSDEENEQFAEGSVVQLGSDVLAIGVNPANPVAEAKPDLSTDELVSIFSGEFKTGRIIAANVPGANSAKNIAHPNPSGAAITSAPPATHRVLTNIGAIPIWGGLLIGLHSVPLKKPVIPTCDQTGQHSRNMKRIIPNKSKEESKATLL